MTILLYTTFEDLRFLTFYIAVVDVSRANMNQHWFGIEFMTVLLNEVWTHLYAFSCEAYYSFLSWCKLLWFYFFSMESLRIRTSRSVTVFALSCFSKLLSGRFGNIASTGEAFTTELFQCVRISFGSTSVLRILNVRFIRSLLFHKATKPRDFFNPCCIFGIT